MPDSKQKEYIKKKWNELDFLEGLKGTHKEKGKKRNTRLRNQIDKSETHKLFEAYPIGFLGRPFSEGEAIEDQVYYLDKIARLLYDMPRGGKHSDIVDNEDLNDITMVTLEWLWEMRRRYKE